MSKMPMTSGWSALRSQEFRSTGEIDADSGHDPFPECEDCLRIVRDDVSSQRRGKDGPIAVRKKVNSWSASGAFHKQCNTCAVKGDSGNSLCASCQHLRLGHLSFCMRPEDLPVNVPVPRPEDNSTCPLCQIFHYIAVGKHSPKKTHLGYPLYLAATRWRDEEVQWRVTGEKWKSNSAFLVVQRTQQGAAVGQILQDVTFQTLKSCLADCSNNHTLCCAPSNTHLPENFRLIDIKEKRIVPLSQSDAKLGYVALSYVWGNTQGIDRGSSTKSSIARMSKSMDLSDLPAAIRDAICVCEKLGERYIWADRVCILQDDKNDKSVQVEAMAGIYSAAKLVIVAASGENMDAGLPGISLPRESQMLRAFNGIQVNVQLAPMWDIVDNSVWNSRAWTYQEVILSKRKLFFTEAQIYFECAYRINHEETLAYPSFDPSTHDKTHYPTSTTSLTYGDLSLSRSRVDSTVLSSARESPWSAYERHVTRYRHRQLSHESDLVNAFTGILNALYRHGDVYYGLPLPELDIALLWTSNIHRTRHGGSKASSSTLFPSWSWASSPGEIPELYNVDFEFRGTLCLWFRPIAADGPSFNLQLVSAITAAASSWCDSKGYLGDDLVRVHMAQALLSGLVEPWEGDQPGRWNKPFAQLETDLRERWPKYPDFWKDIFGGEDTVIRARNSLHDISDKLMDGLLVTRAQVATLNIKSTGTHILNDIGEKIGWYIHDNNNRVTELLRSGQEKFEIIALSVSGSGAQPAKENAFADSEGNLPKVIPIINAMIVRREGPYYYRIGFTCIFMKCWVELKASFQTILLA